MQNIRKMEDNISSLNIRLEKQARDRKELQKLNFNLHKKQEKLKIKEVHHTKNCEVKLIISKNSQYREKIIDKIMDEDELLPIPSKRE